MTDYFKMARRIYKHPLFERDVFSRRDAWGWIIASACYKDLSTFIYGKEVFLKRGQLSYSIRFMAEKWRWDKAKVERFIGALKKNGMIETESEAGRLIITVCNYERFQYTDEKTETPTEPETETPARHQRDTSETNKKKDKKVKKESNPLTPTGEVHELFPIEDSTKPTRFAEFYAAYPKKEDRKRSEIAYSRAITRADEQTIIDGAAQYAQEREADHRPESRQFTKNPTTWLNNDCWENYADLAKPKPREAMSDSEKIALMLREAGAE